MKACHLKCGARCAPLFPPQPSSLMHASILDLWSEGRAPIKGVILVTHNIEEAVLMCDRVLVFREQEVAARLAAAQLTSEGIISAMFGEVA